MNRLILPPSALFWLALALAPVAASAQEEEGESTPVLASPTEREGEEEEESIESYEDRLAPTLHLPEFRIRAGGGVSIPLGGSDIVLARISQDLEWQIPDLEFIFVGLGAVELVGAGVSLEVGARVGGFAWFCEDRVVRCQGAITLMVGVLYGELAPNAAFDIAADVDLRFLFVDVIELFLRGGFFTSPGPSSYINVTGGAALAF